MQRYWTLQSIRTRLSLASRNSFSSYTTMTSTRTPIRFSPEAQAKLDKFPNVVDTSQDESAAQAEAAAFPTSTVRPSQVLQFPGVTYDSTLMVRRLIEEDDRRFHIFGNPSCGLYEYLILLWNKGR